MSKLQISIGRPDKDVVYIWLEEDPNTSATSVKLMSSINGNVSLEGRFYPDGLGYMTKVGYFKEKKNDETEPVRDCYAWSR